MNLKYHMKLICHWLEYSMMIPLHQSRPLDMGEKKMFHTLEL